MRSGQMLVELVLAIAVAILVLVALVQVTTRSIFSTRFARKQTKAVTVGTQGVEWLREQRNIDWNAFYTKSGSYCLQTLAWSPPVPCPPVTGTVFTRTLVITPAGGNNVTAVVTVKWDEGSKTYTANQTAVFYNY